jgi:acetyl esterase/lipase
VDARTEPDAVVRYASHADGVIDVHLPARWSDAGTALPLVVLLHGGFWRAAYDRVPTRPLAAALAAEGAVVATPEYRRVGALGDLAGGWPTTFEDVGAAMRSLPDLLEGLGVAVAGTTVVGHSAGGHLALWLANEPHPPSGLDRVVAVAPVADLRAGDATGVGAGAIAALLGGTAAEVPERYDAADPATRLARDPGCEVVVLHGTADDDVPIGLSRGLAARHPVVRLRELDEVDHDDVVDPAAAVWPVVRAAILGPGAG